MNCVFKTRNFVLKMSKNEYNWSISQSVASFSSEEVTHMMNSGAKVMNSATERTNCA